MEPTWKKYLLYGSMIVVGGMLALILIETVRAKNTGFETKTLWDWLELLIIPLVLAGGAFYLERSERGVERKIAADRAALEREIATDRQQETALQAYLDRMAELLLDKQLRTSENEEVRNVARTRTLTVLRGLDPTRKGLVVRFLRESSLIAQEQVVDLIKADLVEAELSEASLVGANLTEANLSGANLSGAFLVAAELRDARLNAAYLIRASLADANLRGADLTDANLSGAFLVGAKLNGARLIRAHLSGANLRGVDLTGAILIGSFLVGADLGGADLTAADLREAIVNNEQLATARSLKGATMPDGTKHE